MKNQYEPIQTSIVKIEQLSPINKLFTLKIKNKQTRNTFKFRHGQFFILSFPGFGEAPFGFCSSPTIRETFQVSIDQRGSLTSKLFKSKVGDNIGIRGPYGNGFDQKKIKNRNLVLVAGGCGLSPLRTIIQDANLHPEKFQNIQVFYGCRNPELLVFKDDYNQWNKNIEMNLTVDAPDKNWKGDIGVVTNLLTPEKISSDSVAILVGPPIMYKFVIQKLIELGLNEKDIYVSLERRMHCGIGVCQHCVLVGGKYVCTDGPLFSYAEIKDTPEGI
ncbi:MAG: FAD/NAD(P)-binding protein [Candidatus Pacebacteria bacterium]|nr:FAD/NAD(P)-binding protein [Candidatus Paceibacterota bacterium]